MAVLLPKWGDDMVVEHEFGTSGYLSSFIMVQEF